MKKYFLPLVIFFFINSVYAAPQQSFKIGWSGPLTGNSAVLGIDSLQAVRLLIEEINSSGGIAGSVPVELIVEDDQYDTIRGLSAYQSLKLKGASIILASTYGAVFALADKALQDNIIIINPLDCNNDIASLSENTFCIATESESIGRILSEDILSNNKKPVTIIYDEKNPFMTLVAKVMKSYFEDDKNSHIAAVDQNSADYKSILTNIRVKKSDSIVFLGHDPMGIAMKNARDLGLKSQFYTLGTITSPGFQKLAGQAAEDSRVAYWEAPDSEELKNFKEQFKRIANRDPILELASIPSYDAARIVLLAAEQSFRNKSRINTDEIKSYLYNLKDYKGLSGNISMDSDGAVRSIKESVYVFKDGKLLKQAK